MCSAQSLWDDPDRAVNVDRIVADGLREFAESLLIPEPVRASLSARADEIGGAS